MAESLEMSTTAEGVETLRELQVVQSLGCKKIQGYYFGRPMPAADIPAWVSGWQPPADWSAPPDSGMYHL